jgi:hypothetical protein
VSLERQDFSFQLSGYPWTTKLLSSAFALLRPVRTRSWMIERSNSAKTPSILKHSLAAWRGCVDALLMQE